MRTISKLMFWLSNPNYKYTRAFPGCVHRKFGKHTQIFPTTRVSNEIKKCGTSYINVTQIHTPTTTKI